MLIKNEVGFRKVETWDNIKNFNGMLYKFRVDKKGITVEDKSENKNIMCGFKESIPALKQAIEFFEKLTEVKNENGSKMQMWI